MNEGEISNNSMPNNSVGNSSNANEYEQPAAIVSAGAEGEATASPASTNPFGFHAGSRRTNHTKNNNFTASQNVAPISPNAPKFFNDALMANAPASEAPRTSKKPFIIGAIALVAIAAVVVVVALLGKGGGGSEENLAHLREDIAVDFQNNEVSELEDSLNSLLSGEYNIANIAEDSEMYSTMNERISGLESIKEKVSSYKFQGLSNEQKDAFNDLKNSMDKQLPLYKKMAEYYGLLYTYASKNDTTSLDEISQKYSDSELARQAKNVVESYILSKKAEDDYKKHSCGLDETTDVCIIIVGRMDSYDEVAYDESRIAQMFKTIIGSDSIQEDSMISKKMMNLTALLETKDE